MVVEIHQTPYDIINATAYIYVSDVDNVSGLSGKRQHVELQQYLVAVQLEIQDGDE